MKNSNLVICNETIHPGECLSLALPLPELFSCAPLYMPIKIFHGKQAGSTVVVTAAMHGDELNGTEVINRLMQMSLLKKLKGTLILVPVMNVYGLINRSRYLPSGLEFDRCFPGSKNGTHASRTAYMFTQEIFSKADICIDLQTGLLNYSNLPQLYVNFNDEPAKALAKVFNAPVILDAPCEKGMLSSLAFKQGKPYLTYVAGEAMRFDDHAIKVGLRGILNILRSQDILPMKSVKQETQLKHFVAEKTVWVRAVTSGISHCKHVLGRYIKKGEVLGRIDDPFGASDSMNVVCPEEGVIIGKNNLPLVREGEGLLQLAIFPRMSDVADHLEDWKEMSKRKLKDVS